MMPKTKRGEGSTRSRGSRGGSRGRNKTKEFTTKKISSKMDGIEKRQTKKQVNYNNLLKSKKNFL